MTDHPTPFIGGMPARDTRLDRQAPQPSIFTPAGLTDRRAEAEHALAIRAEVRRVELARVRIAADHAIHVAELEAADMRDTEAKLLLDRQQRLSRALAGDDPELRAKFAVLDDDRFQQLRSRELGRTIGRRR